MSARAAATAALDATNDAACTLSADDLRGEDPADSGVYVLGFAHGLTFLGMELVSVVLAEEVGIDDGGVMWIRNPSLDWVAHHPDEDGTVFEVVIHYRAPADRERLVLSVSGEGFVDVETVEVPDDPVVKCNGIFALTLGSSFLAPQVGVARLEVRVEGSDQPPVWVEYEVRAARGR